MADKKNEGKAAKDKDKEKGGAAKHTAGKGPPGPKDAAPAKAADGGKVVFIDVIGDKTSIDKGFLLSSVVWNIEPVYAAMIADLKADTFGTKSYSIGLKDDSVKLLKTAQIPDDVWAEIQALREDVISGTITVKPEFEATAVRAMMSDVKE